MLAIDVVQKTDPNAAVITLQQDFTAWATPQLRAGGTPINASFKLLSDPTFQWKSGFIWEHAQAGKALPWPPANTVPYPAFTSDTDADVVPNADMIAQLGISPYTCEPHQGLTITPIPTPPAVKAIMDTQDMPATYYSGAITSFPYAQLYGIFSMVAKIPKGNGLWPAFWLLPRDLEWPPELDIMEVLGHDTTALWTTVHSKTLPNGAVYKTTKGIDLSLDFHEYACDWGPDTITWYLDGNAVFSCPTPKDMHKACYIIANLAVGKPGSWAGAPALDSAGKPILGSMTIKSIKAWQKLCYI